MGRVWAAHDEVLDRDVAVKELVVPPGLTPDERGELRERLMREARAIARLDHGNVVRVFDILYDGGEPWIVMELVASRSLHEVLDSEGTMAPDQAARIGLAVLAALRAAHRAGLLHRDVKPANVLLADDGRVVLTDFGLATVAGDSSMTRTGIVMGSPSYVAPERALDGDVGPAADLWSLGVMLYAAVEGTTPYARSSPVATLAALATEPPRPPRRAGALTPVLAGLLEKDPARRADADTAERLLRQAAEAVEDTGAVWAGEADEAAGPVRPAFTADDSGAAAPVPRARRRWLIGVGAVLAVLAVLGGRQAITTAAADDEARTSALPAPVSSVSEMISLGPQVLSAPASGAKAAPRRSPGSTGTLPLGGAPVATTPSKARTSTATGTGVETTKAVTGRPFENMMTGGCLDAPDASATAEIQMWACNATDAQRFAFASDGTLRVLGKCVQIRGTDNGARLGIASCTGSSAQRFGYNSAYDLVNVQTDKCVDVPDGNSANGVPAQIWECTGAGNQKWKY